MQVMLGDSLRCQQQIVCDLKTDIRIADVIMDYQTKLNTQK